MVTIFITHRGGTPHPAFMDASMGKEVWGLLEHYAEEVAAGRLMEVRLVNDGQGVEASRRALEEEGRAAEASEARLRAMGG